MSESRFRRLSAMTLTVALSAVTSCAAEPSVIPDDATVPIVREVIDGDTVVVRIGRTDEDVRLIGIDTPETKHPTKPVECFGPEASAFTTALLPIGTEVRLEGDVEERDVFGRLLAYVWRATDGVFVNYELAAQGYADVLTIPPNDSRTGEISAAVRSARTEGRGMWKACGGPGVPADLGR
jgi:micrococcal nuclease